MAEPTIKKLTPVVEPRISPGCMIFAVGSTAIAVLVFWFFYAGWQQGNAVTAFTDETPKKLTPAQVSPEAAAALKQRLSDFETKGGSLTLTVSDLNALLALDGPLKPFGELLQVETISPERVSAHFCRLFNIPFRSPRYFNGLIHFQPAFSQDKGLQLETLELSVPGKTVDPAFQDIYRSVKDLDTNLLGPLRTDPAASIFLTKIASAKLENGQVVLTAKP